MGRFVKAARAWEDGNTGSDHPGGGTTKTTLTTKPIEDTKHPGVPPNPLTTKTTLTTKPSAEEAASVRPPCDEARRLWEDALGEVAAAWNALASRCRAGGLEPLWLDETLDQELQAEVAESIQAADLPRAVAAIDRWRATWLELLAEPAQVADPAEDRGWVELSSEVLGEHVVVALTAEAVPEAQAARPGLVVYGPEEVERLHETKDENLIRAVHAAKKILGGWVQEPRMADGILAEYEGRVPHRNQGVHDMFDDARARLGPRNDTERSITSWLRNNAPAVAALWPDASLDAPWLDWRQHVDRQHVPALDEAFRYMSQGKGGSP